MDKISGVTRNGYKYSVNPAIKKDFDFLELAERMQGGDNSIKTLKEMLICLLTENGFNKLKEHARKNCGCADIEYMVAAIQDICDNPELKN